MPVILVDNSEPELSHEDHPWWALMLTNQGVGAGLNAAADVAINDFGSEWLLVLDQDSSVDHNLLIDYVARAMLLPRLEEVAIIGPALGVGSQSGQVEDVDMVISSGSLVNLAVWRELEGFAQELFVDEVDHEYCLRAKLQGYRVVRMGNIVLPHVPGEPRTVSDGKVVDWHPPQRLYYIARNYWYLRKRYSKSFPNVIAGRKRLVIAKFKAYLRYHPQKFKSILALLKGTLHGMLGKFGR